MSDSCLETVQFTQYYEYFISKCTYSENTKILNESTMLKHESWVAFLIAVILIIEIPTEE